jgi:tetratricopeptide (TPR) repeat protein
VVNSLQGELPAAIEDFSSVIRLKSDFVQAYANRGHLRSRLGDKQGAIADFQTAASIFARQGDQMNSQHFLDMIKKLQG